ncbi:hypothetical protein VP01_87g6 [Puccinia sorghi]|uniref:Uncharacterized protein n=1 Tax=Puccinia sorghi TaxID=27349 RepID=A0A0L6U8D5_9BASI|nr:hypothetical protein VP01_87g6 [Puccinia sorghi]
MDIGKSIPRRVQEEMTQMVESGLTDPQIQQKLEETHSLTSLKSLKRKLNTMKFSRHIDDLDSPNVDIETVVSCIIEIHQKKPNEHNVGYRKMKQLLQTKFGISVHNGYSNKEYSRRLGPILYGTLMGTTNLNNLGLFCMDSLMLVAARFQGYTFMSPTMTLATLDVTTTAKKKNFLNCLHDCASKLVYLQLVELCGGIPRRKSTDPRTETIHMPGHQINLTEQYNPESSNPTNDLINKLLHAFEQDYYNPEDSLKELLFLYLWTPLIQCILDEWKNN